jgi:hypothetical protein
MMITGKRLLALVILSIAGILAIHVTVMEIFYR